MTIQVGDRLPDATFMTPGANGPEPVTTQDVFAGKTVALFAVPGAFTPTCDARHLPGFRDKAAELKAKGVDLIACTSVNDVALSIKGMDSAVLQEMIERSPTNCKDSAEVPVTEFGTDDPN